MSSPEVVLTGGSGFIGAHMARRLLADGARVRILDTVAPQGDLREVDWVEADVRDGLAVARCCRGASLILHLASVVGVDALLDAPVEAIDVAVAGTMRVLEAAQLGAVPLVHLSTSEVLGRNPDLPWDEDADRVLGTTTADRWSYASAKATAEHLVLGWSASSGVPATVIRPFNVYGPGQKPRFVVASMALAALSGEPIAVDGDGSQTRSFTYVDDLIEGLVRVCASPGKVRVLHLGSDDERTILELAKLVQDAVGGEHRIEFRSAGARWASEVPEIPRRVPDVSLALKAFGWRATTPLADGLAQVVAAMSDRYGRAEFQPALPDGAH